MTTNPIITARQSIGYNQAIDFARTALLSKNTTYHAEIGDYPNIPSPYLVGLMTLGYPANQINQLRKDYAAWIKTKRVGE